MRSLQNLLKQTAGRPLIADDVLEFHAARLLLLLRHCGIRSKGTNEYRIDGLTKMAKLDFFVRYPAFFEQVINDSSSTRQASTRKPESPMIRYQYGPWDARYYHVLAYLRAKRLIDVKKDQKTVQLVLTDEGGDVTRTLSNDVSYNELLTHIKAVAKVFKQRSGNQLKTLIYATFDAEVGELPWGETIQS